MLAAFFRACSGAVLHRGVCGCLIEEALSLPSLRRARTTESSVTGHGSSPH